MLTTSPRSQTVPVGEDLPRLVGLSDEEPMSSLALGLHFADSPALALFDIKDLRAVIACYPAGELDQGRDIQAASETWPGSDSLQFPT